MRVQPSGDDIEVTIPSFSRGEVTQRYVQVAPLLFRSQSGATLQFRRVGPLSETKTFRSDFVSDPMSLTRLHWYESSMVFLVSLGLSYATFAVFLLLSGYWCVGKRGVPGEGWVWKLGVLLSLCAMAAPAAGIVMAVLAQEHQLYTIERILKVVMPIFNAAIVVAVIVVALTPSVIVGNKWPLHRQIAFGALGLASLLFLRFAFYWHVWGTQF